MKTKFLIIALAIFSAIFLAACFGNEQEDDVPQPESQEINADTILDNKLFEEAVNSNDASKCDAIKASLKKDECKIVLQSLDLMGKAAQSKDKSLCVQIKLERYKTLCENNVEKAIAEEKEEETTQSIEQEAIKKQDPNLCDQIKDENQKAACKFNVTSG